MAHGAWRYMELYALLTQTSSSINLARSATLAGTWDEWVGHWSTAEK
jgi:hypothetical protein